MKHPETLETPETVKQLKHHRKWALLYPCSGYFVSFVGFVGKKRLAG